MIFHTSFKLVKNYKSRLKLDFKSRLELDFSSTSIDRMSPSSTLSLYIYLKLLFLARWRLKYQSFFFLVESMCKKSNANILEKAIFRKSYHFGNDVFCLLNVSKLWIFDDWLINKCWYIIRNIYGCANLNVCIKVVKRCCIIVVKKLT